MAEIKQFEHLKIQLETIQSATNNFAKENLIGKGGFGEVYKGEIEHSNNGQQTVVALKRLDRKFGQGDPEFWKEIMLLSLYRHENIVSLLGYCDDSGEKILAYDYASNKSLDLYLNNDKLNWVHRLKICIGAARGLAYLHNPVDQTQLRVLHRDIKSANILLDENWNAKIADFGLSKFAPANNQFTYVITNPAGTLGYCDPLCIETGLLTKESDVYSFGVVLFEVLCGRLCISKKDDVNRPLTVLARQCYEEQKINEIIFGKIKDEINAYSLEEFTNVAYQCLNKDRKQRPLMTEIIEALESALQRQCSSASCGEKTQIAGILNVKILKAMGLKKSNNYVILKLTNDILKSTKKTTVKYNNEYPEWNEEFTLYVQDTSYQNLELWIQSVASVYAHVEMHEFVDLIRLHLRDLTPEEPYIEANSYFKFEVVYKPFASYTYFEDVCPLQKAPVGTPQGGGLFVVIIHEGAGFEGKHHTNPYVSFTFRDELRRTTSRKKSSDPKWEEEFTFTLEQPPTDELLHLEVINIPRKRNIFRKEEVLGYATIRVADVVNKKRINKTYPLHNSNRDASVEVELQWRTVD